MIVGRGLTTASPAASYVTLDIVMRRDAAAALIASPQIVTGAPLLAGASFSIVPSGATGDIVVNLILAAGWVGGASRWNATLQVTSNMY